MLYVNDLNLPFAIVGDFNEIGSDLDKLGGDDFSHNRALLSSKLCRNCIFWIQVYMEEKRAGDNNIFERLDKVVASIP